MVQFDFETVYLAAAIDRADETMAPVVDAVVNSMVDEGVTVFDPRRAYHIGAGAGRVDAYLPGKYAAFIYETNQRALTSADLRVFVVDGTSSWGVPMELAYVAKKRLPFALLYCSTLTGMEKPLPVYLHKLLTEANCNVYRPESHSWFPYLDEACLVARSKRLVCAVFLSNGVLSMCSTFKTVL